MVFRLPRTTDQVQVFFQGKILMPSFDVVSEISEHEVANAVDQANHEVQQRFDFKNTGAVYELEELTITMRAQVEFQLKQMLEILRTRLSKRGIDPMCVDAKDPTTNLASATRRSCSKHGIDQDTGRKIQKLIKESKMKAGGDAGRQGARDRQAARRSSGSYRRAAQGEAGRAAPVQQLSGLNALGPVEGAAERFRACERARPEAPRAACLRT